MRALTLLFTLVLGACGDQQLPIGETTFDWGPAGEPLPEGRPVEELVGDWAMCFDDDCRGPGIGLRINGDGTARFLSQRGPATFCIYIAELILRWSYEDRVFAFWDARPHPTFPTQGRMRAESVGDVVIWTQLPVEDGALSFGFLASGSSIYGRHNPLDPRLETCRHGLYESGFEPR